MTLFFCAMNNVRNPCNAHNAYVSGRLTILLVFKMTTDTTTSLLLLLLLLHVGTHL